MITHVTRAQWKSTHRHLHEISKCFQRRTTRSVVVTGKPRMQRVGVDRSDGQIHVFTGRSVDHIPVGCCCHEVGNKFRRTTHYDDCNQNQVTTNTYGILGTGPSINSAYNTDV